MVPIAFGAVLKYHRPTIAWAGGFLATVLYTLIVFWLFWSGAVGVYGPTPFADALIFGFALSGVFIGLGSAKGGYRNEFSGRSVIGFGSGCAAMLWVLGVSVFGSSDMVHAEKKARVIGTVAEVTEIADVIQPADPAHICLVSESIARVKANQALSEFKMDGGVVAGSRFKIGDPTKQFVSGQLWWIFPVEFQGWLKWRQSKEVPGYIRVSAEDPYTEGQAVQQDSNGQPIVIRYLESACWEFRADRYLRGHGYMSVILKDFTFEVDDNWRPFYTVSVMKRTVGYAGEITTGVVTLDLQTGDANPYGIANLPSWIDRGVPLDVIDKNLKRWAKYRLEGWWYCLLHNDKSMEPTEGWFLITDPDGTSQWFTGLTSTNAGDEALTGYTVSDTRTGLTTYVKAQGVTESVSAQAAKSLWSNFDGYEPTELVPYNLYGRLTYVIPMAYNGQFKGVSLVSLSNQEVAAKGATLEEALREYRNALARSGSNALAPSGGDLAQLTITGVVGRVGQPISQQTGQPVIPFTIDGVAKVFTAIYTYDNPAVLVMRSGDAVTVEYLQTGERVIACESVILSGIPISDENPVQARANEHRAIADRERGRIDTQQERNQLLESNRMNNVDPEALKKFLDSQSDSTAH